MNHTVVQREKRQKQEEGRPNLTGIPSQMKRDFEARSQMSYDDVRVHYNSDLPAKVGALAYTQGTQVYLGPGQGRHLRHELTHVAQQKAGLVTPTIQIGGLPVNNDPTLERLADSGSVPRVPAAITIQRQVLQRVPGDTQNDERLPYVKEIAAQRLYDLLSSKIGYRANVRGIRSKLFNIFIQLSLQNNDIPNTLIECGVSEDLANKMAGQIKSGNYSNALNKFYKHYEKFNEDVGADVGNLDPRTVAGDRGIRLKTLVKVLKKFVPQRVENAVKKGREAREEPLGTGIQALKTQDWIGKFAYWLDGRDLVEGTTRFNYLAVNQEEHAKQLVPEQVNIGAFSFGARTYEYIRPSIGKQDYGFAAGPSQVVHEHGHLLEDNLGVNDFANLHRFLRARSRNQQKRDTGHGTLRGSGKGYDAELPPMEFQNWLSRNIPSNHSIPKFLLFNGANWGLSLLTKLVTLGWARDRAQRFVDDFFLQESNSETNGYATQINYWNSTEFVSTTAELLSTERGAEKLIEADPTRVAMFFYLADKTFYGQLDRRFQNEQKKLKEKLKEKLKKELEKELRKTFRARRKNESQRHYNEEFKKKLQYQLDEKLKQESQYRIESLDAFLHIK